MVCHMRRWFKWIPAIFGLMLGYGGVRLLETVNEDYVVLALVVPMVVLCFLFALMSWSKFLWISSGGLLMSICLSRAVSVLTGFISGSVPPLSPSAHVAGAVWTALAFSIALVWMFVLGPFRAWTKARRDEGL